MRKIVIAALLLVASAVTASAADLAARPYAKAPAVMVPVVYDWSGFYVGANVGYGWGRSDPGIITFYQPADTVFGTVAGINGKTSGVIGGAQVGYGQQFGNFVLGVEGDISGTGIKGTVSDPVLGYTASSTAQWLATVRGRGGIALDRVLFYGTGGLAVAGVRATLNDTYGATVITTRSDNIYVGWTAGVGAEWAVAPDWTIKFEYLYVDLGTKQNNFREPAPGWPRISTNTRVTDNIARVGFNYRFGGPVIAKY